MYTLRHPFATHRLEKSVRLRYLQRIRSLRAAKPQKITHLLQQKDLIR